MLLVDDEPTILSTLQLAFEEYGFEVETARSGPGAVARFQAASFDLLLVDKNMPGMSGIELIRELRVEYPQLGIIMITAYGSQASAKETLNLGVDAYLEKPFPSIFAVVGVAQEVLKKRRDSQVPAAASGHKLEAFIAAQDLPTGQKLAAAFDPAEFAVSVLVKEELLSRIGSQRPDLLVLDAASAGNELTSVIGLLRESAGDLRILVIASEPLSLTTLKELVALNVTAVCESHKDYREKVGEITAKLRFRPR